MPVLRVLVVVVLALRAGTASAEYVAVETQKVPVERLIKNLEELLQKDPKHAQTLLNLARVHAMAYSRRSEELEVVKKAPDQLWFGYEAPNVPFRNVVPTQDPEKLRAAKAHLEAAIRWYGDALQVAPDNLWTQLGYAWLLTQTEKKTDSIAPLRKVIAKAWETEKEMTSLGLGGHTIVAEGAGYLLPLLDPDKDKQEIATLKERIARFERMSRPITPIAVPLKPGLCATDLEDRGAAVAFDADGSGLPRKWTWTTRDAAWLVHDPKQTGRIRSGLQLFGNVTFWLFWETGYDALAALDDNHDGQVTGKELVGLALWHDADGNGISESGEVKPLSEHGIVALSCRSERDPQHPDRIAFSPLGVTLKDGTTRPTFDLVLHSRP